MIASLAILVPVLIFYQSCGQISYVHPDNTMQAVSSSQGEDLQTLFSAEIPANMANNIGAGMNYELGMQFSSAVAGEIHAIRYYKSNLESGTHIGHIFSSSGQELARVTFDNETASGWQEQPLDTPLSIGPNVTYVVSVNSTNSYYVFTSAGLASQVVNGDLVASAGVLSTTAGSFPSTNQSGNYFRDIVFKATNSFSDTIAPQVALTAPANNQTVAAGTQVALTASATDNTAVSKVEIYVDSVLKCTLTTSPYTCNLATATDGGLSYNIEARAYDAAGNIGLSSVRTINVTSADKTAPSVQLIQPVNGLSVGVGQVNVTVNATDNVGVSKVEVYASGVLKCTLTVSPYKCTFATASTGNLNYTMQAKAYDAAGNVATSNTNTIIVLAPTPTPATGVWVNQSFGTRTATFTANFDAVVTSANADAVVAFSNGPAAAYPDLAPIFRFNPTGTLDARNGGAYAADVSIPYRIGQVFHVRMVINVAAKTYNVYVTPSGQPEVALAIGYAFRSEQAAITQLNNRVDIANSGTITVSGLTVTQ